VILAERSKLKITYINTADGITKVELWDKADFMNRSSSVLAGATLTVIPIPDDCVLCDFCNAEIKEFPVPVVEKYALCKKCYEKIQVKGASCREQ
jgi:hypothetical protein